MSIPAATDRLIFRHWTIADLQSLHSICSDPAVMQYVGDGEPWSLDRTRLWIEDAIGMSATHRYCRWALASPETTEVIGFCGFVPSDNGAEIGWRLAKAAWGQGFATEAARKVLQHGFKNLGLRRIKATVQSPNRPSIRVCEKLGMKLTGSFLRNGRSAGL